MAPIVSRPHEKPAHSGFKTKRLAHSLLGIVPQLFLEHSFKKPIQSKEANNR